MEYWERCRALPGKSPARCSPIQPEVEKEKKKEAPSCKLQAPSLTVDE